MLIKKPTNIERYKKTFMKSRPVLNFIFPDNLFDKIWFSIASDYSFEGIKSNNINNDIPIEIINNFEETLKKKFK